MPRVTADSARSRLSALVAVGALAACGASTPAAGASPSTEVRHTPLIHVPRGEAQITFNEPGASLTVTISLTGLAPDSLHPAHIHQGSCAQQGRILYPLSPVSANPTGMAADRTSTVAHVGEGGIPASGWYLNVHNGPEMTRAPQSQPIVCGDVANPARAKAVTVPLISGPPETLDQAASGMADLSIQNGRLHVTLEAQGLEPGSSHSAGLHRGSCESQSRSLAPLGTMTADAHGAARRSVDVTELGSMPGPSYVIVHRGQTVDTQAEADPILCGNIGA
ncbi:MAG: CHRD domain-containing protein [Candidatus Dormibacteria bacterium]